MKKIIILITGIIIGSIITSLIWWIKVVPIIVERDLVPVLALKDQQNFAQKMLNDLDGNPEKYNKISRQWMCGSIKLFIDEYEKFKVKHPNFESSLENDYLKAKQFLNLNKKIQNHELQ